MGRPLKLPRHVHGFVDRHGIARYYFRRPGFQRKSLPGPPWSPEFMSAYETALAGQAMAVGASKVLPGSMHALAISYYTSAEFLTKLTHGSQRARQNVIEKFLRETDAKGHPNGDKRAALLQREHVVRFMAARAARPESANALRKALRALMQHAVSLKIRTDDPTTGVKTLAPTRKTGFHTWTEPEITQFEAHHPIGSKPRLALALALYTGQARADVVGMGPQHIRDEVLSWIRKKTSRTTGIELFIPIAPELREILDATPSSHLTFLTTEFGRPFTSAGFGNWWREQCTAAGLPHCTFHGLRKAAARRLAEAGCTPHEIAAITGHATLREIERYTKAASRKLLAESAMDKMRTSGGNPDAKFAKKLKKS
ncbi:MAG TPA: tyrosine-type recombinase/integrase [Xanthobacteraceae bacterium]